MSSLRNKLAMGFGLALLLAPLTGCPRTDSTSKPDGPGPTPKADGFDPDDFEATLRWMALQVEPVFKADQQQNKLLADQRLKEVHPTFAKLAGRKVNWRIKVRKVTETAVYLQDYNLGDCIPGGKDPPPKGRWFRCHLAISASATSTPLGQPFPGEGPYWPPGEGSTLEIGKVISKAHATRLAPGDKVLVSGKIASCNVSVTKDGYDWRFIALRLVEAKSPD